MILRRACKLIAPLERIDRLLTSEKLNGLDKGYLAFFCANRVTTIFCCEYHSMEARERLLQIRDKALRIPPNFVLELENFLSKRLPIHILQLSIAFVIRSCVNVIQALW